MGRGQAAVTCLIVLAVLNTAGAYGQAPQPSLPPGRHLLNQMVSRVKAANSFHFRYVLDEVRSDGSQEVSRRDGDVALRQQLLHLRIAVEAVAPGKKRSKQRFTETQDVLIAGTRGAERHPGNAWLCAAGYTDQTPPMLAMLHADHIQGVRTIGPTTVSHIPVWHVSIAAVRQASAQRLHIVVHVYIARFGSRLVRETLDIRYRQNQGPVVEDRYTVDYSHYGERVHVRVPACRQP